jgi:hypothetical protein
MVRPVYAQLGDIRHRSEVVDYRVEQHFERLGDRLQRLGLGGTVLLLGPLLRQTWAEPTAPRDGRLFSLPHLPYVCWPASKALTAFVTGNVTLQSLIVSP